jgi:hypothetical protein
VNISATPTITDLFYSNYAGIGVQALENIRLTPFLSGGVATIFGKRFLDTTLVAISSNNYDSFFGTLTSLDFTYYPTLSCYLINSYTILSDNILTISIPSLTASGNFNFVIINDAGYDTTYSAYNTSFETA